MIHYLYKTKTFIHPTFFQAIDIWMLTGLSLVIASLLEGALVSYIETCNINNTDNTNNSCLSCVKKKCTENEKRWLNKSNVNKMSRTLFPLVYLVFVVIYWSTYW